MGRASSEADPVDLNESVKIATEMISPPKNISVEIPDPLPCVRGDKTRFSQLFQNLIGNAVKYMDKDKGVVRVQCSDEQTYWRFCVSDNGPGIDPRYHEKIFNIFETLGTRGQGDSTGIGLAVVKRIVEQYEGRVWVESHPGEGSRFFFTLPKKTEGKENGEENTPQCAPTRARGTIA